MFLCKYLRYFEGFLESISQFLGVFLKIIRYLGIFERILRSYFYLEVFCCPLRGQTGLLVVKLKHFRSSLRLLEIFQNIYWSLLKSFYRRMKDYRKPLETSPS